MPQRLLAAILVILFGGLVFLYVQEFRYLSNTIGVQWLVAGSMLTVAVLTFAGLWLWRDRFIPLDRHLPEVLLIGVFSVLFAPLWGSLINRSMGKETHRSFIFESETAYYASGYGILKGEKLKPTGWKLRVNDKSVSRLFTYKSQSYYPLSKPGDVILLPINKGLFGFEVILLK